MVVAGRPRGGQLPTAHDNELVPAERVAIGDRPTGSRCSVDTDLGVSFGDKARPLAPIPIAQRKWQYSTNCGQLRPPGLISLKFKRRPIASRQQGQPIVLHPTLSLLVTIAGRQHHPHCASGRAGRIPSNSREDGETLPAFGWQGMGNATLDGCNSNIDILVRAG